MKTAPDLTVATYFTSTVREENPDVVERFARAINKSLEYAQRTRTRCARCSEYTEIPPEAARQIRLPIWRLDLSEPTIEPPAELAEKYGLIESKPDLDELIQEPARRAGRDTARGPARSRTAALPWLSGAGALALFEACARIGVLPADHFPPMSDSIGTLADQVTRAASGRRAQHHRRVGRSASGSPRPSGSRSAS